MANDGETLKTFETMPRPSNASDFTEWLVPARNNIQREMLRLRPVIACPTDAIFPTWIFQSRHLVLGACFSLWRSVFQVQRFYMDAKKEAADRDKAASWFLDEIIHNNAATYATELNAWSLEYYVENAVYRLRHAKKVAIDGGVDERLQRLPEPNMIGESDPDRGQHYFFPRTTLFTPFGEWEECFHAARALDAMQGAIQYALILQRNKT